MISGMPVDFVDMILKKNVVKDGQITKNLRSRRIKDLVDLEALKQKCVQDFHDKLNYSLSKKQPFDELKDPKLVQLMFESELSEPKKSLGDIQAFPY